ncbi:MAG TPA: hypothetical protein VGF33_05745 [Caulobacteraceae bacterium]|jgi:hypothetical protein
MSPLHTLGAMIVTALLGVLALARQAQWSFSRALDRFVMGVKATPLRRRRFPHGPYGVRIPGDRQW